MPRSLALTVEEKTVQKSAAAGGQPKSTETPSSSSGKPLTTIYARFCFSSVLAQQARALVSPAELQRNLRDSDVHNPDLYASDLTCGEKGNWDPLAQQDKPQPDILPLTFTRAGIIFSIVPRSAYGVFEFLGTLMKLRRAELEAQAAGQVLIVPAYIPPERQYAVQQPTLITVHEDPQLLQVLHNLGGDCFVHTWFRDGGYCVPEEATTTKRIFGLLAQLIAIQTAARRPFDHVDRPCHSVAATPAPASAPLWTAGSPLRRFVSPIAAQWPGRRLAASP
jgi:hypothetical protein